MCVRVVRVLMSSVLMLHGLTRGAAGLRVNPSASSALRGCCVLCEGGGGGGRGGGGGGFKGQTY